MTNLLCQAKTAPVNAHSRSIGRSDWSDCTRTKITVPLESSKADKYCHRYYFISHYQRWFVIIDFASITILDWTLRVSQSMAFRLCPFEAWTRLKRKISIMIFTKGLLFNRTSLILEQKIGKSPVYPIRIASERPFDSRGIQGHGLDVTFLRKPLLISFSTPHVAEGFPCSIIFFICTVFTRFSPPNRLDPNFPSRIPSLSFDTFSFEEETTQGWADTVT